MGCSNQANDRDAQMLEEAAQGASSEIDPSLVDATVAKVVDQAHQTLETLAAFIFDILPLSTIDVMEKHHSEIHILPSTPSAAFQEQAAERLRNLKDKDILVYEDRGRLRDAKIATVTKYPESVPKVDDKGALAQPLIPTVENLRRMLLKQRNPRDQFGKSINWHHDQQQDLRLIPMQKDLHQGKGISKLLHSREPLSPAARKAYRKQRKIICQRQAEEYLGEYWAKIVRDDSKFKSKSNIDDESRNQPNT